MSDIKSFNEIIKEEVRLPRVRRGDAPVIIDPGPSKAELFEMIKELQKR
jgi:hypothetical protein